MLRFKLERTKGVKEYPVGHGGTSEAKAHQHRSLPSMWLQGYTWKLTQDRLDQFP